MVEPSKKPRGRPRKYSKNIISEVKHGHEFLTDRGAQNSINYGHAMVKICDHCTTETQLYFLGGITGTELHAGALPKRKVKRLVMAEMGRHPPEEIVEMAEAMANNRTFDTWTQQEIVDFLKDIRLGRSQ